MLPEPDVSVDKQDNNRWLNYVVKTGPKCPIRHHTVGCRNSSLCRLGPVSVFEKRNCHALGKRCVKKILIRHGCIHLQAPSTEWLIPARSRTVCSLKWIGEAGVDASGAWRRTASPAQRRITGKEGGGHDECRRWLASWITSAGQSGSASTGGRGGTRWRLLSLEFWSVGQHREWLNDWLSRGWVSCIWSVSPNLFVM